MIKKLITLAVLAVACCLPSYAQQITTYNVLPGGGGVVATPYRVFNIPLTDQAAIPWLELSNNPYYKVACGVSTSTPTGLGFIFVQNTSLGPDNQCFNTSAPVTNADNSQTVTFSGTDEGGIEFTASFTWSQHIACHRVSGRVSRNVCSYVIDSGELSITRNNTL